jgi:hypothetical protein
MSLVCLDKNTRGKETKRKRKQGRRKEGKLKMTIKWKDKENVILIITKDPIIIREKTIKKTLQ